MTYSRPTPSIELTSSVCSSTPATYPPSTDPGSLGNLEDVKPPHRIASRIPQLRLPPPSPRRSAQSCSRSLYPSRIPVSTTGPPPRLVRLVYPSWHTQSPRRVQYLGGRSSISNTYGRGPPPPRMIDANPTSGSHPIKVLLDAPTVDLPPVIVQPTVTAPGVRRRRRGGLVQCFWEVFRNFGC